MTSVGKKLLEALCRSASKSADRESLRKTGLSDEEIDVGLDELEELTLVDVSHEFGGGIAAELTEKGRLRCGSF